MMDWWDDAFDSSQSNAYLDLWDAAQTRSSAFQDSFDALAAKHGVDHY